MDKTIVSVVPADIKSAGTTVFGVEISGYNETGETASRGWEPVSKVLAVRLFLLYHQGKTNFT